MRDTTKYHLQAIGSISGEIRNLTESLKSFVELQTKQVESLKDFYRLLENFKEKMDTRFNALGIAWDRHLQNALISQELMIKRVVQRNLIEPLLPKKTKKEAKKPVKKRTKK